MPAITNSPQSVNEITARLAKYYRTHFLTWAIFCWSFSILHFVNIMQYEISVCSNFVNWLWALYYQKQYAPAITCRYWPYNCVIDFCAWPFPTCLEIPFVSCCQFLSGYCSLLIYCSLGLLVEEWMDFFVHLMSFLTQVHPASTQSFHLFS